MPLSFTVALLVTIALFLPQCAAIDIVPHFSGGHGLKDTTSRENTVTVTLARTLGAQTLRIKTTRNPEFLAPLKAALRRDGCELIFSGLGQRETFLMLSLHCAFLNNTQHVNLSHRTPLPPLENARQFLGHAYHYEVRRVEYMAPMRDQWWYGNYETLDQALRQYQANKKRGLPTGARHIHTDYTQVMAQWGLDRVDQHYGMLDGAYNYINLGVSVDVYIVDTGIRTTHQEFSGGRATFLVNTVGDGINTDCNGHGTMVASLAGGATFGVAKGVNLWAVKVLDCAGNGDTFTITTGAIAIAEHAAIRAALGYRAVASFSLGGDASQTIDDALLQLIADNITVVVAAGNEYGDACSYSPSRVGGNSLGISVGASNIQDTRPSFSNAGRCVTISAPGTNITGASASNNAATVTESGTSMSTPFVSGVAALVLDQDNTLSVAQVRSLLNQWATPAVVAGASAQGGGKNLLYSVIQVGAAPNLPPSPSPTPAPPPPSRIPIHGLPPFSSSAASAKAATLPGLLLTLAVTLLWTGLYY